MKRYRVYALGQDRYWLRALTEAAGDDIMMQTFACVGSYPEYLDHLPAADPKALLLIDATGQIKVEALVRKLREQSWQCVVVVAADPTPKEARALLRGKAAYDYWAKSYVPEAIRRDLERCLKEIEGE